MQPLRVMRAAIRGLRSGGCKHQMPDRLGRQPHLGFDVVAEDDDSAILPLLSTKYEANGDTRSLS